LNAAEKKMLSVINRGKRKNNEITFTWSFEEFLHCFRVKKIMMRIQLKIII